MSSPRTTNTSSSSRNPLTTSTNTTSAPDHDPFAALKAEMRLAQEARVMSTAAYIWENYGLKAALAYEIGEGVIHEPSLLQSVFEGDAYLQFGDRYRDMQIKAEVEWRVRVVLGNEEPQRVLDEMACETDVQTRVWAAATRKLRELRKAEGGVGIPRAID